MCNYFLLLSNKQKFNEYFRPIRGVTAVLAGAGPGHALYFASYELSKEFMTKVTKHNHINYCKLKFELNEYKIIILFAIMDCSDFRCCGHCYT